MFQSLLCQGLLPRVLRVLVARIGEFKCYSIVFVDRPDGKHCLVRTWESNNFLEICVDVQPLGQSVPQAELSSLSCVLGSIPSGQLPVSIEGSSPSLLRVIRTIGMTGINSSSADISRRRCSSVVIVRLTRRFWA